MTPVVAIVTIVLALSIYTILSFLRFPAVTRGFLSRLALQPAKSPNYVIAILLFAVWAGAIWALDSRGYESMALGVWSGTVVLAVVLAYFRNSRSTLCERCGQPNRIFRKGQPGAPAIIYVHVCEACKVYRERLIVAVGSGD